MALKRSDHPFCPSQDLVATLTQGTVLLLCGELGGFAQRQLCGILNQTLISIKHVTLRGPELF